MDWPEEVKRQLGREPRVGDWYTPFNNEVGFQLKTAEQLAELYDAIGELMDDGTEPGLFFATEEALSEHFGGMG